jgi:hypothetical protein
LCFTEGFIMTPHSNTYNTWINPNLPDLVRFARQKELKEMEAAGLDISTLTPWDAPCLRPFISSPRESKSSLPELVRFAREREENLPKRSLPDDYLTPWDGLSQYDNFYLYHHAEPLMPLRGRDFDVMECFFSDDSITAVLEDVG